MSGSNAAYLESQYEAYREDPQSVTQDWRDFFSQLPGEDGGEDHHRIQMALLAQAKEGKRSMGSGAVSNQADAYVAAMRRYGHLCATLDPLGLKSSVEHPLLQASQYGLPVGSDLEKKLKRLYCGTVGVEFEHIMDHRVHDWLVEQYERIFSVDTKPSQEEQLSILRWLTEADGLEKYLGQKYPGQKRFSLEGGDALIPMLKSMVYNAIDHGVKRIDFGMAHRGRLNVLVNVLGKPPANLFREFEGKKEGMGMTSGDVKYHLGYSSDWVTEKGPMHLSLACNPSHLEIISPVVMGGSRAVQDQLGSDHAMAVLPVLIHGDAAFAGQGIVMETFAMANTRAYGVGGSIHVVVNNQVGFTTSDVRDARSSRYCSDAAKAIEAPVLHVNGDDPEAVVKAMRLALAYRMHFGKDFVIDLVCYRRHGHQEVDEPVGTQPLMYQVIKQRPALCDLYAKSLVEQQVLSEDAVQGLKKNYRQQLEDGDSIINITGETPSNRAVWARYLDQVWDVPVDTAVPDAQLKQFAEKLIELPKDFTLQKQVATLMAQREKMAKGELAIDWGFAELLAYASLLHAGHGVRLTGQDVRRGTFSHRHVALHDMQTGTVDVPLAKTAKDGARLSIYDSILSEAGVLGFEYGYASSAPNDLVMWEAQFGDFVNGAQVVIDQFISSAWQKWERMCGLVMLLPHGYEGQGPEHSSARLERFLHLCAQQNIQVCMPSHAAQIFHLLRRQVLRPFRVPLIIMAPKSLLRLPGAKCDMEQLSQGGFDCVIDDDKADPKQVTRVVMCAGKVYYDLLEARDENELKHIALLRIEQLYPFPGEQLKSMMDRYTACEEVIWCQEEPRNQGAWRYIRFHIVQRIPDHVPVQYVGRAEAASPAAGYPALHKAQQSALVRDALGIKESKV